MSPCIGLLQQAGVYAANNNFVGTTTKQPTYLPFGEAPTQCLNPVMLKIINTFVPPVSNSAGGLAVTRSNRPTGDKNLLARGDYHPSDKHSFDVRYDYINSNAIILAALIILIVSLMVRPSGVFTRSTARRV